MPNRQKAPSKDVRSFIPRHIGPSETEVQQMLDLLGVKSLDALIDATVPESIRLRKPLAIPAGLSEHDALNGLRATFQKNQIFRSYLGYGYAGCLTPPVIQRNILENPGWYTAYTPYQAEIAQGRLEALLNFQTVIIDLTGLEIANASLLDEGTAAAEAMLMCHSVKGGNGRETFFVDASCHPQTTDVVQTRARARGFEVVVGDWKTFKFTDKFFGALISYPTTDGAVHDYLGSR
jgi:glycine dehydrogenase